VTREIRLTSIKATDRETKKRIQFTEYEKVDGQERLTGRAWVGTVSVEWLFQALFTVLDEVDIGSETLTKMLE